MQRVAVVDLKENLAVISFFWEGWKEKGVEASIEIRGNFLDEKAEVAKKIKEAIEKQAPDGSAVILLIPREYAQLTSLKIPAKNMETLKSMMEFEVLKHFPLPIEQLAYSYFVTGGKAGNYELNLAGLKQAEFKKWFDTAIDAGIRPEVVSVSSSAWLPVETENEMPEKRIFIELAPTGFEVSVIDGSSILYSRYKKYGKEISENLLFDSSIESDSELSAVAEKICKEFDHIRLVSGIEELENYNSNIFVSGGGRQGDDLTRKLIADPLFMTSNIVRLPKGDNPAPFSHTSTAVGASALFSSEKGFNFIPIYLRSSYIEPVKKRLKVLTAVAVSLLFLWGGASWGIKKQKLIGLQNELQELKSKASTTEERLLEVEKMQSIFSSFTTFINAPSLTISTLSTVTSLLPSNTYLTDFEVRRGEIVISGISSASTTIVASLEKSRYFSQARLIGPVKTVDGKERFRIGATQK